MPKKDSAKRQIDRWLKLGGNPYAIEIWAAMTKDHRYLPWAVRKAFEAFKLNPEYSDHWKVLTFYLCDAYFGRTRGRPNAGSLSLTREQLNSNDDIAESLKKQPRYRHLQVETLRKKVAAARKRAAKK